MAEGASDIKQSIQPAAEFQALPLEFIVATPLVAVVRAQERMAVAMADFITKFKDTTVTFEAKQTSKNDQGKDVTTALALNAPLLSMIPVPHLRINSLTVNFKYEIAQTVKFSSAKEGEAKASVETGSFLSPWVKASVTGSVSSRSAEESSTNRSGMLDITVHASEAEMPAGLARILSWLAHSIPEPPAQAKTESGGSV